jgi:hypothetical protein
MIKFQKRIVPAIFVHILGISLFGQNEVHEFTQEGVVPAREISFDIRPFKFDGLDEMVLFSLEGMDLAVIEQDSLLLLEDGTEAIALSPSTDGWYRIDVVKRYLSQDLEISVDGYPTLLMFPKTPLDLFRGPAEWGRS